MDAAGSPGHQHGGGGEPGEQQRDPSRSQPPEPMRSQRCPACTQRSSPRRRSTGDQAGAETDANEGWNSMPSPTSITTLVAIAVGSLAGCAFARLGAGVCSPSSMSSCSRSISPATCLGATPGVFENGWGARRAALGSPWGSAATATAVAEPGGRCRLRRWCGVTRAAGWRREAVVAVMMVAAAAA